MALEGAGYISDIVPANPDGADQKNEGDDHIRNFKKSVQDSFANVSGPVTATHTQLNYVTEIGDSSDVAKGDALIVGKRTDVGASEFTLHKYNENRPYNVVTDFGADNTGASDCSTEVQAAFTAAIAAGRAAIYFPAGLYKFDSQVAVSSATAEDIVIYGDGVDATEIRVPATNTTGAISVDHTGTTADSKKSVTTVRDLSIVADGAGCGTALEVLNVTAGNLHRRNVFVHRVDVRGSDISADYFLVGINVTGCWRPSFDTVNVGGPFGPGVDDLGASSFLDSALRYKMTIGINVSECYHPEFDNCYVWSAALGISASDVAGVKEGFRIRNTNIVNVRTGIEFLRASQEPTFWLSDCHINHRDRGLDIDGCKFIKISGLVSYNEDTSSTWGLTPADILIDNTEKVFISQCVFHQSGPADRVNIQVVAPADTTMISENIFNATAASGKGIDLGSSATNSFIVNNEFTGTYGKNIDTNGKDATIWQRGGAEESSMQISSQDNDANRAPEIDLYRNTTPSSVATNDILGQITFSGNQYHVSDTYTQTDLAAIRTKLDDATATAENAQLQMFVKAAGTLTHALSIVSDAGSDQTNMYLLRNNGSTTDLRRVELAPISGGYQVLRVAST